MGVIRQVTLQRANRKSDKSISISFVTSLEESTEDFMEVDKLVNSSGILYYSEKGTLTKQETDEIDKVEIEVEGKTMSQKIRNKIWVLWSKTDKEISMNEFYKRKTEKILLYLQKEIDNLDSI